MCVIVWLWLGGGRVHGFQEHSIHPVNIPKVTPELGTTVGWWQEDRHNLLDGVDRGLGTTTWGASDGLDRMQTTIVDGGYISRGPYVAILLQVYVCAHVWCAATSACSGRANRLGIMQRTHTLPPRLSTSTALAGRQQLRLARAIARHRGAWICSFPTWPRASPMPPWGAARGCGREYEEVCHPHFALGLSGCGCVSCLCVCVSMAVAVALSLWQWLCQCLCACVCGCVVVRLCGWLRLTRCL